MRTDLLDKIAEKIDLLFAIAMAAAIGLAAVSLALQLRNDQAAFDTVAPSQQLSQSVDRLPLDFE
jgi:CHASE3 domain sensor protein